MRFGDGAHMHTLPQKVDLTSTNVRMKKVFVQNGDDRRLKYSIDPMLMAYEKM